MTKPGAGLRYHAQHTFAPGLTRVLVHKETPEELRALAVKSRYSYGFSYGFLRACLLYHLLL